MICKYTRRLESSYSDFSLFFMPKWNDELNHFIGFLHSFFWSGMRKARLTFRIFYIEFLRVRNEGLPNHLMIFFI